MTVFSTRKSPRMKGFDYRTPTSYFITVCSYEKRCIFGTPSQLNHAGQIAREEIMRISRHYPNIHIDHAVVMPNHIHILMSVYPSGQHSVSISTVIAAYKAGVSRKIHEYDPDIKVWQRSFYDHIVKNEKELEHIWQYIENNPIKWDLDKFYSE